MILNVKRYLKYLVQNRALLVAQTVKNLPAVRETWVQSLGWEDPLEKEVSTHCSILSRKIPWTEEPGRLQSMESQSIRHNWMTNTFSAKLAWFLGEGPVQVLENCYNEQIIFKMNKLSFFLFFLPIIPSVLPSLSYSCPIFWSATHIYEVVLGWGLWIWNRLLSLCLNQTGLNQLDHASQVLSFCQHN